jgi:bifunctional non-homologous end joining protein LigD
MLLSESSSRFDESQYCAEVKHDGYRVLCGYGRGDVQLRSKSGADCTRWFPEIVQSLSAILSGEHIVDGEMVVQDGKGRSDFNAVHARAMRRRWSPGDPPVVYAVFDILVHNGRDVTRLELEERKELLRELLTPAPPSILYVDYVVGAVSALFQWAAQKQLEGIVAKRRGSIYRPGVRSPDWRKMKCIKTTGFKRAPLREDPAE